MPIVTIEILEADPASGLTDLPDAVKLQEIADDLGALFGSQPSGTWVKVRRQPRRYYAENDVVLDQDLNPVMVEVLKADIGDTEALAIEAAAVCSVVARKLGRDTDHVHVVYLPSARGRVAFGGRLVR
ncbi:MAG: hypothetical protein R3E82_22285 [Pseudomonadales bacterium]|nr:hypothetical protein [Pseudomonadales bacterium]